MKPQLIKIKSETDSHLVDMHVVFAWILESEHLAQTHSEEDDSIVK